MIYYYTILIISVISTIIYFGKAKKNHNVGLAFIFFLIITSLLGHVFRASATTLEGAEIGNYISYMGGCFFQIALSIVILDLCRIKIYKWVPYLFGAIGFTMYGLVITNGRHHLLYRSVWLDKWHDVTILQKEYGPVHTLFYVYIVCWLIINIAFLIVGIVNKKEASIRNIICLLIAEFFAVAVYFVQKFAPLGIDITTLIYVIIGVFFLFISDRLALYSVYHTVAKALFDTDEMGCMTFSAGRTYIGSDDTAQKWFEELKEIRVDSDIWNYQKIPFLKEVRSWMDKIDEEECTDDGDVIEFFYTKNNVEYKILGSYILDKENELIEGYQFTISDYTTERNYVDLLEGYNNSLEKDVRDKTEHILDMHDRFVRGMADMVEGRDSNTGGHIKRTSEGVAIIVNAIANDPEIMVSDEFCKAVIKAAPMHDLGKITVDDAILRKPGKFEPEEFEIMKGHAANGAQIVKKLLADLDDDYFASIAENVAHYHHERVDGSGYPCKLKGDEIPLEARIMAIADVYDALVSKRCYKDRMSFDKAFEIIEEGMGTQFDDRLNKYFIESRELLEAYYTEEFRDEK